MSKLHSALNMYSVSRVDVTEAACLKAAVLFRPGKIDKQPIINMIENIRMNLTQNALDFWHDIKSRVSRTRLCVC